MNQRMVLLLGGVLGVLAVIAGTFGAHGLDQHLDSERLEIFHTGQQYHMYHALAILGMGWATGTAARVRMLLAISTLVLGVVLFSGALYALAIFNLRWLGIVAPVGGVLLIAGWCLLILAAFRRSVPEERKE